MLPRGLRPIACALVMLAPACVVKLTDRNAPAPNGAVTGAPADCSKVQALPHGAPGGNAEIKFLGRFDVRDPNKVMFDWSGNEIIARFQGTSVTAYLGAFEQDIIFEATIDGRRLDPAPVVEHHVDGAGMPIEQRIVIAENLPAGEHEVVLHRNTEPQNGATVFFRFDFGGGTLLPPTRRARQIEIIGDSITCGYGNEGQNATCPFDVVDRKDENDAGVRVPVTENQYLAYGSIAGRTLDADVKTICWSGKGVERNYRERPIDKDPNSLVTVPTLWRERTVGGKAPGTPLYAGGPTAEAWNFAKETEEPQVVLIHVGTNDFTRDVLDNQTKKPAANGEGDNIPDGDIDRQRFRDVYRDFVRDVRAKRPNAHIFLAVPPMLTDQYPLDNARTDLKSALLSIVSEFQRSGDTKVYEMEFVEQGVRYGLGCDYHPNLRVHQIMADQLVGAIRSKTCW